MNYIILYALTALASLFEWPVESGDFRVSAGIIVFMVALHHKRFSRPILMSLGAGLVVTLFRVGIASLSGGQSRVFSYLLEISFYVGYGIVYTLISRYHEDQIYPPTLLFTFFLSDFGGNLLEFVIRNLIGDQGYSSVSFLTLFLAALLRSLLIILFLWIWHKLDQKARPVKGA